MGIVLEMLIVPAEHVGGRRHDGGLKAIVSEGAAHAKTGKVLTCEENTMRAEAVIIL